MPTGNATSNRTRRCRADNPQRVRMEKTISKLRSVDWSRANPEWEGRAMVHGRISKATTNVTLTASLIKKKLGVPLSTIERELESRFSQQ